MPSFKTFASDNNAVVHADIIKEITSINLDNAPSYGEDLYTRSTHDLFRNYFGDNIDVHFVFNGTAANVVGLASMVNAFNSVICSECAHIYTDECNASERFIGCKLQPLASTDGKIRINSIKPFLDNIGIAHFPQPKAISLSQATEMGTVYTPYEIRKITKFSHENQMYVHMDGARLANAAASLNCRLKEITSDVGVDILSFGGTKNGLMYGEAIVVFNRSLGKNIKYIIKQYGQLGSKMRYIAAQFNTLLRHDLWLSLAQRANAMARKLEEELSKISEIKITQKVQTNMIFAILDLKYIHMLKRKYSFYIWNKYKSEVRIMTSFATTEEDVMNFIKDIKYVIKSKK